VCKRKRWIFLHNGILYRHTKIVGRPVDQLVVPKGRRDEVSKLAHTTFGAHQLALNTAHRICNAMRFSSMMKMYKEYVKTCAVCCRQAHETCFDRVPVKPIPKDEVNIGHWFIDVCGPLSPNQSNKSGYNYFL
jgi:hypothetical protein